MKKNNLLKTVLLFVFAVLLLGCRQEADVLSQKNAQSNNNAIKMVSLSDIPQVTSFIKNKTGRKDLKIPFKNRNTHKLASISPIETIDLETNIIVEKVEDDIKYYVFNIDNIGDDKTIYNLEIKAVNGIVNDLKVVEYASTTSLAGDTNLKLLNFTGTVSTYNLDGTYRSSVNYIGGKGDCPNPEEPIYPSDPSNPTSPIDGSGSGSGGGLYDSGSPSDPSSGFDGGGSWWINYGGSSGNTRGNDGSNTSGDGAGGDGSSSGTPPSTGCNPNSYVFLQDVISNGEVVGKIYINDCGVKVFRSVLVSGGALRLSGDCGSGSGVILLDELDLKFEKYIRSFLAIDKYNYLNLPENEEFRDGLKQYYANNVGQPNLQTFLSWAVDFKNSNPNTSWTQFQNWFSLNKSIDADLVNELKNIDSNKFAEYIQINKDLDSFDLYLQDPSYNPLDSPWLKKAREYAQKLEDWSKYLGPKAKAKAREMIDKSFIYALNKTAKELFGNVENLSETQKQSYFQTDGKKGVAILLYEFANGLGKDRRDFSFDYNITQQFLQGKVTGDIRNDFLNNLSKNGLTYNQFIKNGNMIKGGYAFSPDHTTVEDSFSKHYNANWVQFFIGGANAEYYPTNENGWIRVVIWNQTTRNSLMLHQGENYDRDGSGNNLPLSTIKQYFSFKLQIY